MPASSAFPAAFRCYTPRHHKIYGCICLSPNNNVLVVRGRRTGKWSFPKGHMESTETSLDCALRELEEETGINLRDEKPIRLQRLSVGNYFFFELDDEPTPCIRDSAEVEEAEWIPVDRLVHMDCNVDINAFLDRLARSQRRRMCEPVCYPVTA